MIKIPTDLLDKYTVYIGRRGVKTGDRRYYTKWLHYYLDFCHKYRFDNTGKEGLPAFDAKLKEKK